MTSVDVDQDIARQAADILGLGRYGRRLPDHSQRGSDHAPAALRRRPTGRSEQCIDRSLRRRQALVVRAADLDPRIGATGQRDPETACHPRPGVLAVARPVLDENGVVPRQDR